MDRLASELRRLTALQQPAWADPPDRARAALAARAPLVPGTEILRLRAELASVARGERLVVQAGDCAESPDDSAAADVRAKRGLLRLLADELAAATGRPVLRVGRIAGQYGKPRSQDHETVGGRRLPVYRGHLVNRPEPDPGRRRADPANLLRCHDAARQVLDHLDDQHRDEDVPPAERVRTSHEALLLDYELPQLREESGQALLTSTHWPWVGERTRQPDGAQIALLAAVANPVAVKVGPGTDPHDLLDLCRRLDPDREPGRLTLVARMGRDLVGPRLPALVTAVRRAGHPVVWLTDPMHGNTVVTPDGFKTRLLDTVVAEVCGFLAAVHEGGGVPGGLHLETTPDEVTECVDDEDALDRVPHKYLTLCDPRLTPGQAARVIGAWAGPDGRS
ncbi:3-deoxy-7-phosphoheptulonate synthase [Kitasatospora phosalacinea]|uniref:3-deoxy-7-phosphoheptulonate synthase n=1 Tax=Kitasatospora phosalacinea TaxID=2065 RepID=UPI0036524946